MYDEEYVRTAHTQGFRSIFLRSRTLIEDEVIAALLNTCTAANLNSDGSRTRREVLSRSWAYVWVYLHTINIMQHAASTSTYNNHQEPTNSDYPKPDREQQTESQSQAHAKESLFQYQKGSKVPPLYCV